MDGNVLCKNVPSVHNETLWRIERGKNASGQPMPARIFRMNGGGTSLVMTWESVFGERSVAYATVGTSGFGMRWLLFRPEIEPGADDPKKLGLAVTVLRPLWEQGYLEISKRAGDAWVEIDTADWEQLNGKTGV